MRDAFGFDVGRFVFYGGYPGAVRFVEDWERWRSYVLDSLVETTVSRDVLLLNPVTKPALLRQLFSLACSHSGEIPAYNKMLGQLHDVGNATTLVHYLQLLSGAGIVSAIPKFSGSDVRRKASIPKLIVHNTGLVSAVKGMQLERAIRRRPLGPARRDRCRLAPARQWPRRLLLARAQPRGRLRRRDSRDPRRHRGHQRAPEDVAAGIPRVQAPVRPRVPPPRGRPGRGARRVPREPGAPLDGLGSRSTRTSPGGRCSSGCASSATRSAMGPS